MIVGCGHTGGQSVVLGLADAPKSVSDLGQFAVDIVLVGGDGQSLKMALNDRDRLKVTILPCGSYLSARYGLPALVQISKSQ